MPSADAAEETNEPAETDEARSALLEAAVRDLGSAIVESKLEANHDLWIRVDPESWVQVLRYFRDEQRFRYFDWLTAIDWKQSPFGRSMDAEVDNQLADEAAETETDGDYTETGADGYAGGETRFQVMARVSSLSTGIGINIKTDIADDDLTLGTITEVYPGANWHEREAFEMFGIAFLGHPQLQNLYLPGAFEGFPMRKDYPLVARMVKPWPGIVDVEPMPEVDEAAKTTPSGASTTNPQDGGVQ